MKTSFEPSTYLLFANKHHGRNAKVYQLCCLLRRPKTSRQISQTAYCAYLSIITMIAPAIVWQVKDHDEDATRVQ